MATPKEIAEQLGISDRRVRDLLKSGILPGTKGTKGYNLTACREAYVTYLRGLATGQARPDDDDADLAAEKRRLEVKKLSLEIQRLERQDRVDDARWMHIEDHWRLLAGLMVVLRELLDFHVQQVAPELCELAGGNPEAAGQLVDRLGEMIGAAYNGLAGAEIEHACFGDDPHAGGGEAE